MLQPEFLRVLVRKVMLKVCPLGKPMTCECSWHRDPCRMNQWQGAARSQVCRVCCAVPEQLEAQSTNSHSGTQLAGRCSGRPRSLSQEPEAPGKDGSPASRAG